MHALELASALTALGHEPVVHAPDPEARGFFRQTAFETVSVRAAPIEGDTTALVVSRVADYVRHFEATAARRFDVFHAQDGISGNALATLKADRVIPRFARTVHHLDDFADPRLSELQNRSVTASDARFVVSRMWREQLRARFDLDSTLVGNGVDLARFRAEPDGREPMLRARLGLGVGPIVLAVGGVEQRKNTRVILEAFCQFRRLHDGAQLMIAGGASVLDHTTYRVAFDADVAASGLPAGALVVTGPMADDDMPALYRLADMLAFPSVKEGFGLVALEAMASGLPVVVSQIAPFTEYLSERDVVWCDPASPRSVADAMMLALSEPVRSRLAERGPVVAARHGWVEAARAHLEIYARLAEVAHA
ncbi:MAG: MSMEG_0565 family glycosyltransferase, partial [Hansschlegelia sp.]